MRSPHAIGRIGVSTAFGFALLAHSLNAQSLRYPSTRRDSVVGDYFGAQVPAPFRWLEDQNSHEVEAWVDSQNAATFGYLEGIPLREPFRNRLTTLWNYERVGLPNREAGKLYFSMNSGLQNQSVIYEAADPEAPARAVLDPNALSPDGSVALAGFSPSPDGRRFAYGLSQGGSDWRELHVRSLTVGHELADTVHWVKFSGMSWTRDGAGFFYSRFPAPPAGEALSARGENQKVYYHLVGTPDASDRLIYERPDHPDWYLFGSLTDDGRFLFITVVHGTETENRLYYVDLGDPKHPDLGAPVVPLVDVADAEYVPVGNLGDMLFIQTTNGAPNRRIVSAVLPDTARAHWRTVVPEARDVIESSLLAGGRIVVGRLRDVKSVLTLYTADGRSLGDVALPGIGTVSGLSGRADSPELFYSFTSYLSPQTVYRYDFSTTRSTPFHAPQVAFDAGPFETRQVFYSSKDGTRVPMFITLRKDARLDGSHPTVLYAYGGFDISITPSFSPVVATWLEHGGVYAVANLRGGGEYGEAWHRAGMLERKQNVFDDFIAAAEYLVAQRYTAPAHLAIHGYSNGGLLVGAVMAQRPDLFAAAYPGAGVMDMLRYQKFTAGVGWVPEYGSSDDSAQFRVLYAYSPLHNLRPGICYPATIVTAADHDDRVVPAHSYKFMAALQADQACDRPVVIRIDTKTSHGYMPTDKRIAQLADIWAFTGWNTGMRH
jgi:prolyl oligopeptidase